MNNHVYIIAEAGIAHDGNFAKAVAMVHAAKEAGCDAVKFQTYRTETICKKSSKQFAWLKKCELSFDQFRALNKLAKNAGIDFISTPDDEVCAKFLASLKPKWMKIGSAKAKDPKFIGFCSNLNVPLIVSTGMASDHQNWYHVSPCDAGLTHCDNFKNIKAVLHCTSSYPCPAEDMNLSVITDGSTFRSMAGGGRISGLSDHSRGTIAALVAVGLGARMLEKHFDIEPPTQGPDRAVSAMYHELEDYVWSVRNAEKMLGDGIKRIMPSERATIKLLKARGKS